MYLRELAQLCLYYCKFRNISKCQYLKRLFETLILIKIIPTWCIVRAFIALLWRAHQFRLSHHSPKIVFTKAFLTQQPSQKPPKCLPDELSRPDLAHDSLIIAMSKKFNHRPKLIILTKSTNFSTICITVSGL